MGCLSKVRRKSSKEILHIGPKVKSYLHGYGPRNPYQIEKELNFGPSKTALAININRMAKIIYPDFSIIDAAPAMEGHGPLRGSPRDLNLLLCSNDPIAIDSLSCNLVGIDLEYNQYVKNLERFKQGTADFDKIEIINRTYFEELKSQNSFKLHDWFQYSKFTQDEIELLKRFT